MRKRRRKIKNFISVVMKLTFIFGLTMILLISYPALRNHWNDSGINDFGLGASNNVVRRGYNNEKYAVIGEAIIDIEIVSSTRDRGVGLSGRNSMPESSGMFFVFENDGYHGIWMKDMNFSIDILWIDYSMTIIHIEKNISPDTFPRIFKPSQLSRYVLELPAGFVEKHGVKIQDKVDLL